MNSAVHLGVDGCRAGWVSVQVDVQAELKVELFPTIQELWDANLNAELILVDIPIGLRDKGGKPRLCDIEARKYLTRKRSSGIFPTPCRAALHATSYLQAKNINIKLTGKGLSKQTWNITSKIREVDALLQKDKELSDIFIESGPELCFSALAKGKPMQYYKKTKDGLNERLNVLKLQCKNPETLLEKGLKLYKRSEVTSDDILDAWVLAVSASKGRANLRFLPKNFEHDSTGLPMRIAIPRLLNHLKKQV